MNLSQITSKLSPKGWLMVGGSAVATIAFFYLLMSVASAPSYTTIMAGINLSNTGKIESALTTAGVAYELQSGGTAVAVESGQVAQAQVALANVGLSASSSASSECMSQISSGGSLGQSNFQQSVAYQSCLEQQLNGAINSIQGVSSANVQLAIPSQTDQLFGSTESASASVLISDSGMLGAGAVRGIADLVANAVTGLSPDRVTITDQDGQLLWPSSSDTAGGLLGKQSAEASYDSNLVDRVNAGLAAAFGSGVALVSVNADLNTDQVTQQSLVYGKKGLPQTATQTTETLTGATPSATTGGTPTYTAGTTGNSKYKSTSKTVSDVYNKTITTNVVSPGTIIRQTVSVLVSSKEPAATVAAIKSFVAGEVGFNAKRGDTLTVAPAAFKTPVATPAASSPTQMIGYAKYGLVGLGALLFLFFTSRMLKRRENEAFQGVPTWLRELESPRSLAELEAGAELDTEGAQRFKQLRSPINVARQQVDDLVDRDPDRVAAEVRRWMSED